MEWCLFTQLLQLQMKKMSTRRLISHIYSLFLGKLEFKLFIYIMFKNNQYGLKVINLIPLQTLQFWFSFALSLLWLRRPLSFLRNKDQKLFLRVLTSCCLSCQVACLSPATREKLYCSTALVFKSKLQHRVEQCSPTVSYIKCSVAVCRSRL